ncbi:membrane protein insertase YidC [Amycolatopsis sp. SID8362]|uniref:YidC/Oxa1 family membrane protein insertase n=1 Tax=Amycolatopsis sp. SID8362 TaxID=2690346 RepID=UPI001368AD60|nr:membrane protein insertase YidC [Amycolatopsis sp. SID8362]NBH06253.1 membrane protein insertase YidC [Amycolatopsis sp. SID8362]NED42952.1 YidC/Oxa1 family membrane protein insertase [Amycolatopsis sp. SID8362]
MFGFLDVPVSGAYHLIHALTGPFSTALAIVVFTLGVRLLLHPLARSAARGERARATLLPQLRTLQEKHGKDRDRLAAEMTKLQRESGTSLFTGCLPMLLQLPFFTIMYRLFTTPVIGGEPNSLLGATLLGTPLGAHGLSGSPLVFVIAAGLAVVAWFSVRLQAPQPDAPGGKLLRLLPYGTVLATLVLPQAAGLYLLTTTAWTAAERALLRRRS